MTIDGLSTGRLYAYILRLRIIASDLQNNFINPSEEDIKDFLARLGKQQVRWGSGKEHNFQAIMQFKRIR